MESSEIKAVRLKIGGMTCINCQKKIERGLLSHSGVKEAKVSWEKGEAEVTYDEKAISLKEICSEVERLGYRIHNGSLAFRIGQALFFAAVIALIFFILQKTGVMNLLVPSSLASSKMGYGLLFVTGLLTSVHCLAMCGGINASQSLMHLAKIDGETGATGKGKSNLIDGKKNLKRTLEILTAPLFYNLGRVLSYSLIGMVLGTLGFFLSSASSTNPTIPLNLQGSLKIIAGFFMLLAGLSLLDFFPFLRKFSPRLPSFLSDRIASAQAKHAAPFIVGFLNGFMPCGPLQAMWLIALASANPLWGALSMLAFSLGTVPLMLFFGSALSLLGKKYRAIVMKAGSVLVIVMALSILSQGFALGGWTSSSGSRKTVTKETSSPVSEKTVTKAVSSPSSEKSAPTENKNAKSNIEMKDGKQIVKSRLNPYRYPFITVKKGIPVHWEIEADENSLNGCNYRMIFQDFGFQYQMGYGTNVIEFTPEKAGNFQYTCWMGMVRGMIKVEE